MSLQLFRIDKSEVIPTDETTLESAHIYIIVDKLTMRPKIWVWSGKDSDMKERYFAGVNATKIKSFKKLYGASIEVVEEGNEPEHFPHLKSLESLESIPEESKAALDFSAIEEPIEPEIKKGKTSMAHPRSKIKAREYSEEEAAIQEEIFSEASLFQEISTGESQGDIQSGNFDLLSKQKLQSFLRDLMVGLDSLRNQAEAYLKDLKS